MFGADAHEGEGRGLGEEGGFAPGDGAVEVDGGVAEVAAAGGEQVAREAVGGQVVAAGGGDPVLVGLDGVGPEAAGEFGLHAQQIAAVHGLEVGEGVVAEEPFDELGAFVGPGIVEKRLRLGGARQGAGHVQEDPAEKHGVIAAGRGGEAAAVQFGGDQRVHGRFRGCRPGGGHGQGCRHAKNPRGGEGRREVQSHDSSGGIDPGGAGREPEIETGRIAGYSGRMHRAGEATHLWIEVPKPCFATTYPRWSEMRFTRTWPSEAGRRNMSRRMGPM